MVGIGKKELPKKYLTKLRIAVNPRCTFQLPKPTLPRAARFSFRSQSQHGHKEFTVVGGIDTVKFLVGDKVVAEHRRDWDKKKTHYNPVHYLAAAEKRPNSFEFGEPFAERARRIWRRHSASRPVSQDGR